MQLDRLRIKDIVTRRSKDSSFLICPPSTFKIISKSIDNLSFHDAYISTDEYWHVVWTKDDKKYDVVNKQKYKLKKVNGKWLIDANIFMGKRTDIALKY